jgi:hypothetical protein
VVFFATEGRGEIAHLAIADGAATTVTSQRDDDASRLLGFRPGGGVLVLDATDGRQRVTLLGRSGTSLVRRLAEEQFVVDYVPIADRLLLTGAGEDTGDKAVVSLTAVDSVTPPRRWLASHPQLADIHFSRDGGSALFIDRAIGGEGRLGGSVFRVAVGSDAAELVLRATTERSFSLPIPRPSANDVKRGAAR